eukprot:PRCOL_00004173-RA
MMPEKRAFLQSAAPPGVADAMAAGALVAASGQERSQLPGGLGASMLTSPFADSQLATQQRAAGAIPQVKDRHEKPDDYWTMNHLKLMYLISRYSHFAQSVHDKERWIRKLPLLVLIYEGVVQKVFDYDYAPSSEVIEARRVYINISQEGKDDLDDLTEGRMIKGLRLSTKEHQSVTAYQITLAGVNMISKRLPDEERQLVDDFIFIDGQQLQVAWEEGTFLLRNDLVSRESTITECEDVSYVSSPHIPRTLRRPGGPSLSSNAHRAHESAGKVSTIRDDLDEVITLSNVTILVGEWLPFGANQIVELNIKLGANERCQGGYFTSTVDQNSTATQFEVPTGLTQVRIVDYDLTRFTNIEAEVYFPEEEGIVQIECFGIHARLDGTLVYGMLIEAVMDRILENISLDNLARLLVDVHIDSSKIMESLISNHQRDLLDMVFLGNTECRDKVNCIIAERVLPKRRAAQYMDRDAFENEIRQVLGDTYEGYDLTDEDVIVTGSHGIMVTGPNAKLNEPVLLAFLSLRSRDVFVQNLFSRLFIVDDTLKTTRKMINEYERDPNSIPRIRRTISETSKDIILLEEILLYLSESLSQDRSIYQRPSDPAGVRLYDILDVDIMIDDLKTRIEDMEKILQGARHEVDGLRNMTDTVSENQMFKLQEEIRGNSADMLVQLKNNERQSTSLDVMQVIFAGSLAFELLDRLTGEWSVVHTEWGRMWIVEPLMNKPMVWFIVSMLTWGLVGSIVFKLLRHLNDKVGGVITYRIKVNKPIDLMAMEEYLAQKPIQAEDGDADRMTALQKVIWADADTLKWEGYVLKIELLYDIKHGFLLSAYMQITRKASEPARLRPDNMKTRLFTELQEAGVLTPDDAAEIIDSSRRVSTKPAALDKGDDPMAALRVRCPGDKYYREIPYGMRTYEDLREEVAIKFGVRPLQVVQITKGNDVLVGDDEDVSRLVPGTMLDVLLKADARERAPLM